LHSEAIAFRQFLKEWLTHYVAEFQREEVPPDEILGHLEGEFFDWLMKHQIKLDEMIYEVVRVELKE
jgi:hemerythrin